MPVAAGARSTGLGERAPRRTDASTTCRTRAPPAGERQPAATDCWHEVDPRDELGHGVLDLDAGVQLEEEELAAVEHELGGACAAVADRTREGDGRVAHACAQLRVEPGRGGLLKHLLMAPLHGALAFAEREHVSVRVGEQLHLDMAGPRHALAVDRAVAEGRCGLRASVAASSSGCLHDVHAAPAASCGGLHGSGYPTSAGSPEGAPARRPPPQFASRRACRRRLAAPPAAGHYTSPAARPPRRSRRSRPGSRSRADRIGTRLTRGARAQPDRGSCRSRRRGRPSGRAGEPRSSGATTATVAIPGRGTSGRRGARSRRGWRQGASGSAGPRQRRQAIVGLPPPINARNPLPLGVVRRSAMIRDVSGPSGVGKPLRGACGLRRSQLGEHASAPPRVLGEPCTSPFAVPSPSKRLGDEVAPGGAPADLGEGERRSS